MTEDLATTLLIKPGTSVLLLNAPIGFQRKLAPLPDGVTVSDKRGTSADVVVAFARDTGELKRLATAFPALEEDGILWVCYPNGGTGAGTDLDRDVLRAAMTKHDLAEQTLVAFDEQWSAMRFRATDDVGS
ncbi:MAG TPA: hypothetical protein VHG53_03145 [Candidatus Limnocylindria bacterium]|nr:hypothetical protein [Candidatus Limnocylindria bacterium]